jgi:hypothetical protein
MQSTNDGSDPVENAILDATEKMVITVTPGAVFVDHDREYKDICTKLIVEEFFATAASLFNFMNIVLTNFSDAIAVYAQSKGLGPRDIIFVYAGGNVLRIVEKEFAREMPADAAAMLSQFYAKDFSRSDADFSIYIKPGLENFAQIVNDMTSMSYTLQDSIRAEFKKNLPFYFDYFKYSTPFKKHTLGLYAAQFESSRAITNPENPKYFTHKFLQLSLGECFAPGDKVLGEYSGVTDKYIEFGEGEHEIVITPQSRERDMIYVSENRALHFQTYSEDIRFNLVRTKINFNAFFNNGKITKKTNISGELIDVSIPLGQRLNYFFEDLDDNLAEYTLDFEDGLLNFNGYSISYLVHDLENMLILNDSLPWTRNKYAKRLNRLFYLYFINLYTNKETDMNRKVYLEHLLNNVLRPLHHHASPEYIKGTLTRAEELNRNYLMDNLVDKLKWMLKNKISGPEFDAFVGVCIDNVALLVEVVNQIMHEEKDLDERKMYDGDVKYSLF